jgi:MoxR-like ATPase
MITSCPPYEDVLKLLELYNVLCFRQNLLIKGPKGTGKTLSLFHFSHINRIPVIIVECSEDTKKRDLVGSFYLKGKETPYILGAIPTAIDIANEYGKAILLLEEINALTPQTQKDTNAALDFRKMVTIPQVGKTYKLEEGKLLWVTATMNPSVYGGTYDLNEDLRSRLDEAAVGYPPPGLEKKIVKANVAPTQGGGPEFDAVIEKCIRLAGETRQEKLSYALSPRDVVRIVQDIQFLGLGGAMQLAVCKFEGDDVKTIMPRIDSIFGVSTSKTWGGTTK